MAEFDTSVTCPHCDKKMQKAAGPSGSGGPRDGDPALCVQCGQMAMFQGEGLRVMTVEETETWGAHDVMRRMRESWQRHVGSKRH